MSTDDHEDDKQPQEEKVDNEARRRFLKKSAYAAYASPLITALLVEEASAADSLCTQRAAWFCWATGYRSNWCKTHCR